jgi:hypothetical protein
MVVVAVEISSTVSRFPIFAGTLALSLTQPAVSLAQPPPAPPPPVYRAPMPSDHHAPSSAYHAAFPAYRPLPPSSLEIPRLRPAPEPSLKFLPYRYPWQQSGWGWSPAFLSSQLPCFGGSSFWGPWGLANQSDSYAMPDVTLGSLVDGQSRNFLTTYPSYGQALTDSSAAAASSGPTLQYGFQQVGCGSPYSFGL